MSAVIIIVRPQRLRTDVTSRLPASFNFRYGIMTKCWQENPDGRPTFTELRNELKEMENQHKVSYRGIDFQLSKLISVINHH